jgi:hypothetical protein
LAAWHPAFAAARDESGKKDKDWVELPGNKEFWKGYDSRACGFWVPTAPRDYSHLEMKGFKEAWHLIYEDRWLQGAFERLADASTDLRLLPRFKSFLRAL